MRYLILASLLLFFANTSSLFSQFKVEENEDCIISKPLCISYKYNQVLFADRNGKMVFLYSKEGKLLKTFTPAMRFSDSIAVLADKPKDKRFVLIDEYAKDYPHEIENGGLKNALGNIYINCCFKDSQTVTCGGICGVLMKKPKYAEKNYGISTQALINEYNIKTDDIKSMPLPKPYEPYGVVKSQTMFYLENKDSYVMDFSTFKRPSEDSVPFYYALSILDSKRKFKEAFFEVPDVLQAPFLSDDYIRICSTKDDSLWCSFPKIMKIYNPESNTEFDLELQNNTNSLFLDSMAQLRGKYSDEIDKRIDSLYKYLKYEILFLSNMHDNILVCVKDLIEHKYFLQVYSTKGEFLKESVIEEFKNNEELSGIAYSESSEEFLFILMKDEEWYFSFKEIKDVL